MKNQVVNTYKNESFQKSIRDASFKIKDILEEFISEEESKYGDVHKINRNINSRIKSVESFEEKLERNDYINAWNINDKTDDEIQNVICDNLPDLIGFRINCYFDKSEKILFEDLRSFLSKRDNIETESNPNTKQKNGNYIAKIACFYKDRNNKYPFEVQIKSYLNDVWGEVEHDVIYKSKIYDSRDNAKKEIMKSVNNILKGTDKELDYMYNEKITVQGVKEELFYHLTHDEIFGENSLNVGNHYNCFFDLLKIIPGYKSDIDSFLGKKLLNEEYEKKEIEGQENRTFSDFYEKVDLYKWDSACKIFDKLYIFECNDKLLEYLICQVIKASEFPNDTFDESNDSFADDDYEEEDKKTEQKKDLMNKFECILKRKAEI